MLGNIALRKYIGARLRGEGIVLCDDPAPMSRLEMLMERVQTAIPGNILDGLHTLFAFRESEQPENLQGNDGWFWWFDSPYGLFYAIGLSVETLEGDEDYCILVLLHEIAHLRSGQGHNASFSGCLDKLIAQYNRASGAHIVNDYTDILLPDSVVRMDAKGNPVKTPRIGTKRRGLSIR